MEQPGAVFIWRRTKSLQSVNVKGYKWIKLPGLDVLGCGAGEIGVPLHPEYVSSILIELSNIDINWFTELAHGGCQRSPIYNTSFISFITSGSFLFAELLQFVAWAPGLVGEKAI